MFLSVPYFIHQMRSNERPKNPSHPQNATFEYIFQKFEVQWKCDHYFLEMCSGEAAQAKTGRQKIVILTKTKSASPSKLDLHMVLQGTFGNLRKIIENHQVPQRETKMAAR